MPSDASNTLDFKPVRPLVEWTAGVERVALVGVLNLTPDSFSDGGKFFAPADARAQVTQLLGDGADVIEIGGESTRPAGAAYGAGFTPIDDATQIARIAPALEHAHASGARVAVDTTRAAVARFALERGATIVNDVSCLVDVELARAVADHDAWLVLMHNRTTVAATDKGYRDVVADVAREWSHARDRAVHAGVRADRIVCDPGLGFAKGARENINILSRLGAFHALGHAVYVGASRKAFIGAAEVRAGRPASDPKGVGERLGGTVAACLAAVERGAAALRVHDVRALHQALAVHDWIAASSRDRGPRVAGGGATHA